MTEYQQFLTVSQVAKKLQVSTQTVRNWVKNGILPAAKVNARVWRINENDVKLLTERQ